MSKSQPIAVENKWIFDEKQGLRQCRWSPFAYGTFKYKAPVNDEDDPNYVSPGDLLAGAQLFGHSGSLFSLKNAFGE